VSELPPGWAQTSLDQVARWGSGGTPSRSNLSYYGGGIPWIKTGELGPRFVVATEETLSEQGLTSSSAKLFPKGAVAIAMYGATIGKTSILGIEASTNQACAVAIPDVGLTSSEYLYHYLCSQREAFVDAGKGGAQPNISQGLIRDWPFPLAPLPEQKRIADKLDALLARVDACRGRLDRVPRILKRFRQSVLAAATSGELTREWREERGIDPPITETLGDVLKVSSGKFLPAKEMTPGGTIPVFGGNGVNGYHDKANVEEETLVIGRVGFYCGSVHLTPPLAWVTDNALIVRHDHSRTVRRFLYFALQAVDLRVNDSSTAQPVISGAKIYPTPIAIPDVLEQVEIVRRLDALLELAENLERQRATVASNLSRMVPSVLAKAFRGELVPQDPTDEPASKLLSRLRTRPDSTGTTGKPKRTRKAR
jgi:type I restriction enzyme, S subunit